MERHFYIRYNRADREWAEWIARQLQYACYTTALLAYDFGAGTNLALKLHEFGVAPERTIAVLTRGYPASGIAAPELAESSTSDPAEEFDQLVSIDLTGLDAEAARETLLKVIDRRWAELPREPGFSADVSLAFDALPNFPGPESGETSAGPPAPSGRCAERAHARPSPDRAHYLVFAGPAQSKKALPVKPRSGRTFESLWSGLSVLGKALTALGGLGGIAALLTALFQMGLLPSSPDADPSVEIANATLRQVLTTEQGEMLDIAYDITLTNMEGDSILVRGLLLDAQSRELARTLSAPSEQRVSATSANDSGQGSIRVPLPLAAGCVVVRIEVYEKDGDRVDDTETPPFDPFDPSNPTCPRGTTSTEVEVTA